MSGWSGIEFAMCWKKASKANAMKAQQRLARFVAWITVLTVVPFFASCATLSPSAPTPKPISKVSPFAAPPRQNFRPRSEIQEVRASWYGRAFAGHKTITGESYDPEALTAASKTLPLGAIVKVSNPKNGKSVKVRINDRGPFVRGRSMDLSHAAAKRIGILRKGVARVKVEKLTSRSRPSQDADTGP